MEIQQELIQGKTPVVVLRLQGIFDSHSAGMFNECVRQAVQGGARDILLDFGEVPYMSSVGLRSLSAAYDWLHPQRSGEAHKSISEAVQVGAYHAPHLKLLRVNERVRRVLDLAGLDLYFEIFEDEEMALAAFG